MAKKGRVDLVGAGPGDPGLLTLKGKNLLSQADVVVYDHLANPEILAWAGKAKEFVAVGKSAGHHTMAQQDINKLLVKKAKEGCRVVRLKGGDPFVFGRGGEEVIEIRRNEIPFSVVPGITSGISAPAYAGIPVTERSCTSTLTFVTGHGYSDKNDSAINWKALAENNGTLIFYMGVMKLPLIAEKLIAYGKDKNTPVAIIRNGTFPSQKVVVGTLSNIDDKAKKGNITPPSIIVIGEVVSLRKEMMWFEELPLFGKKILITRSRTQSSSFAEELRLLGAETYLFPTISIEVLANIPELNRAISHLSQFDWILFTSVNAVEVFFTELHRNGFDSRALSGCKIGSVGSATKTELSKRGIGADLIPDHFTSEALYRALKKAGEIKGKRILLPRSEIGNESLPRKLSQERAAVTEIATYRPVPVRPDPKILNLLKSGEIDIVPFTSSSIVRNYAAIMKKNIGKIPKNILYASIGPETTKAAVQEGIKIAVQAKDYTIDGLIQACVKRFSK